MRRLCVSVALLLLPCSVWAQSTEPSPWTTAPSTAAPSATTLPPIIIVAPKQNPRRTVNAKRPAAKRIPPGQPQRPATIADAPAAPAAGSAATDTIVASPVPGSEIARDKVPANAQVLPASDFDHAKSPGLLEAIGQRLPGVSLGDQTGNQFQLDVNYRGFTA